MSFEHTGISSPLQCPTVAQQLMKGTLYWDNGGEMCEFVCDKLRELFDSQSNSFNKLSLNAHNKKRG